MISVALYLAIVNKLRSSGAVIEGFKAFAELLVTYSHTN